MTVIKLTYVKDIFSLVCNLTWGFLMLLLEKEKLKWRELMPHVYITAQHGLTLHTLVSCQYNQGTLPKSGAFSSPNLTQREVMLLFG